MSKEMIQYVVKKLNNPAFNIAEVARKTGLGRSSLSEIASGKTLDPLHSTVVKIYDYFKSLDN
jgi:transcriptional regulator with XRE-family HTH domain